MKSRRKRARNDGLRKICGCPGKLWPKCSHPWHFSFKPKGQPQVRVSLDKHVGHHVESVADARGIADTLRDQIRAGTFRSGTPEESTPGALTLERFAAIFVARSGGDTRNEASRLRMVAGFTVREKGAALGVLPLDAITEDDLELFVAHLKAQGRANSTRNHYVQTLKKAFKWAAKKGYLARNPISEDADLKRSKPAQRHRRLDDDEEAALLRHAPPHLQRLIIAALETAMRLTELLRLQWRHVSLERLELLAVGKRQQRLIPISQRLLAVLEMARVGPDGQSFEPDAYVFGNAVGERLTTIKRAWQTCVLKAHGHAPTYTAQNGLSKASQRAYEAVDLVFHDLRHEAGSRKLEAGWPLHAVRDLLGHASLEQTSTYLNVKMADLHRWMRAADGDAGKLSKHVANTAPSTVGLLATGAVDKAGKPLIQ